jgi:hypothetical protein
MKITKSAFLLAGICIAQSIVAQSFVSPIGFVQTEANQQKVIRFIESQVKRDMSAIGMNDPMTLRMMEQENLDAFKELIRVSNTAMLRQVIETYCEIGMCNYATIWMMYQEQRDASQQNLKW